MSDARRITTAETAKIIRAALKREFPAVKFSVRSKSYSGGSSIDIGWTDGPTRAMVDAVTGRFNGKGFDGMIDLAYYITHWLGRDGSVTIASNHGGTEGSRGTVPAIENPAHVAGAELVRFGSDYVFANREVSSEMKRRALDSVKRRWHFDADVADAVQSATYEDRAGYKGHTYVALSSDPYLAAHMCSLSDLVFRDTVKRVGGNVAR